MSKTNSKRADGHILRSDLTLRFAISPTTRKAQGILNFIDDFIAKQKLPKSVENSLCI
jgi:hypothetical protein